MEQIDWSDQNFKGGIDDAGVSTEGFKIYRFHVTGIEAADFAHKCSDTNICIYLRAASLFMLKG